MLLYDGRGGTYRYYRCTRRHGPCSEPYVQEAELHRQSVEFAKSLALPRSDVHQLGQWALEEQATLRGEHERREKAHGLRETAVEQKLERLLDLHLSCGIGASVFESRQRQLLPEKLALSDAKSSVGALYPDIWFEHFEDVVKPLNEALKISPRTKIAQIAEFLRKTCSDHYFKTGDIE
ncbi:MAG: hypothetical protein KIT22_06510 [Verrucomicrobiae bacterium]|nr:hypothetical protein [Verrucomicrobiae bacterium]